VKKRADMAMFAERRIGKPHWLVVLFAKFNVVFGRIHRGFLSLLEEIQVVENHLFTQTANSEIRWPFTERFRSGVHENISRQLGELAVTKKHNPSRSHCHFCFSLERGTAKSRHCNVVTGRRDR
jgi:hypothetical protein